MYIELLGLSICALTTFGVWLSVIKSLKLKAAMTNCA